MRTYQLPYVSYVNISVNIRNVFPGGNVWTNKGKGLARRGESTPILRITTMADIGCMKAQSSAQSVVASLSEW